MNMHFDFISNYTFDVITKTWFSVSKFPALVRVYNPFYQHSCWWRPLTGKYTCLLYTSDAADDMQCVDLGGRRIIKK